MVSLVSVLAVVCVVSLVCVLTLDAIVSIVCVVASSLSNCAVVSGVVTVFPVVAVVRL